ncbi:DUF948 domain-containing protein [Virgibacillus flavescens]|uniref:DUF948 domain-containing protein n=1 Tax=Virgibacillus flavescens TaxID=1611422 RepID=UPI003D33037B
MDFVYIGVFLCALGFAIIAIFLAKVLKRTSHTLNTVGTTLKEVETKLHYITTEIELTIKEADKLADDMEEKLKATDDLFATLESAGNSVNKVKTAFQKQTKKLSDSRASRFVKPAASSIQWGGAAKHLYKKWKNPSVKPEYDVNNKGKEGEI